MAEGTAQENQSQIKLISIVGAGTMGSGIALAALYAGWQVRLYDVSQEVLEEAEAYLAEYLERKDKTQARHNLSLHGSIEDLAPADLWVEAAPERLELKQEIFQSMESVADPEAILATNTSTLSVAAIAAVTKNPERVIGLHFFNPAAVMPLVELIATDQTNSAVTKRAKSAMEALGKTVVRAADSPGFIVNRVARPFYSEALQILTEGLASIEQIDRLVQGIGFPMGPFRLMDFIGNDVNLAATQSVFEQTFNEPRFRPHLIQQQLVQAGKLGRKSGEGFYRYPIEKAALHNSETSGLDEQVLEKERLYVSDEGMAPGLVSWLADSGVEVVEKPELATIAILAQAKTQRLIAELEEIESSLPHNSPILCQTITAQLPELAAKAAEPNRIIGADSLFMASGEVISLAAVENVSEQAKEQSENLLRGLGKEVEWVSAGPGMVLPRIMAMLVNEATLTVQEGIASESDIDRAMELGVRYPKGPLRWGQALGFQRIYWVLKSLIELQGDPRYGVALLLRRWALEP